MKHHSSADVVICGAGIAGISTAYYLSTKYGIRNILIVDERPPLSLTSDKSSEAYRNFWPGPGNAMVALMNRSIDLMQNLALETGNIFHLNRHGYLYVTGASDHIPALIHMAQEASHLGAGPLRIQQGNPGEIYIPSSPEGFTNQPEGIDLILDKSLIHKHFPCLSERVLAGLHARRAGWFSAHQLGMYMLDRARAHGTQFHRAKVVAIHLSQGKVAEVQLADGQTIRTGCFVNAAGPFIKQVGSFLIIDLPVFCETHMKVAIKDHLAVLPREAPLIIWNDPQVPAWTGEEREFLKADPEAGWMLAELPAGAHIRPEGSRERCSNFPRCKKGYPI